MTNNSIRKEILHDGHVARITLARPKANILDRAMMLELIDALHQLDKCDELKAIIVGSEGPHFSFGASIEEHLPGYIEETLGVLRGLLEALLMTPAPVIAAVRGQCLGGGFELALACDLIVAADNAQFGLPEIKLGVFPPAGTVLLPIRIGASRSAEIILTGKSWGATWAQTAGLIHEVAPEAELDSCLEKLIVESFLPRSSTSLRYAAQAARRPLLQALKTDLPELERLYLDELMYHPDGTEGIQAFLEKRQPRWATDVKSLQ